MNSAILTNPAGLWALAALAAVAVLYLFRRRHRPIRATGLFLWGLPGRTDQGGRNLERPPASRSLLLDLGAAALLALALAGPALITDGGFRTVVILDDSFAMRSRSAHRRAAQLAGEFLDKAGPSGRGAAVILAGEKPRVLSGMDARPADAKARLADYLPSDRSGDLAAAVGLAKDVYGDALDFRLITNQMAIPAAGPVNRLEAHILAGSGGNLAFTELWRERSGAGERLLAAVANHADTPATADLEVRVLGDGQETALRRETLALAAEQRSSIELTLSGVEGETLVLSLAVRAGEDNIEDDSMAYAPPVPSREVTFAVRGMSPAGDRYFRLALEAAGCLPLSATAAGETLDLPDLLVTTDPEDAGRTLTLEVTPPTDPVLFRPPLIIDLTDPLCRDVALGSMSWAAGNAERPEQAERVYIMAGDVPLFWRSGPRRLRLNLLPERSEIVASPAWPAMLANVTALARDFLPGLGASVYRPGETLRFVGDPSAAVAGIALYSWDTQVREAASGRALILPKNAGLYELRTGGSDNAAVAVTPLYGSASDARRLADSGRVERVDDAGGGQAAGFRDLSWLALAAAVGLLFLNWRREKP